MKCEERYGDISESNEELIQIAKEGGVCKMIYVKYVIEILALTLVIAGLKVTKQWEERVVFRLGKLNRTHKAGLCYVIPIIEESRTVDKRTMTFDVKPQDVMTKDSVSINVDAVIYYKVFDVKKAILEIEDFESGCLLLAQSKLREVIGKAALDEVLSQKDVLGKTILSIMQDPTDVWGVNIVAVEIKNIEIAENMRRAIAKEAEASREKIARMIKADAEFEASKKFEEAARNMSERALALRQLQTWQEIGAEQNSLIILVPTEFASIGTSVAAAKAIEQIGKTELKKKATTG